VEPDANISPRKRFLVIRSYWRFFLLKLGTMRPTTRSPWHRW
jgi:hypothetical protein